MARTSSNVAPRTKKATAVSRCSLKIFHCSSSVIGEIPYRVVRNLGSEDRPSGIAVITWLAGLLIGSS